MKNRLATLALAALPALVLSACNGSTAGSGVSALPNGAAAPQSKIHPNKKVGAALYGGGATFPAYGYNLGAQPVGTPGPGQPTPAPGSVLFGAQKKTKGAIYYCLTGSGFGRKEFEANNGTATVGCAPLTASPAGFGAPGDPLDFVGSDVAMASTECCASGTTYSNGRLITSPSWGQPFELPTFGGPIVFPYNASSFSGIGTSANLQLSTWTYCAIANGTISNWNDAAITADNGGSVTGGTGDTLNFYFRSDGSGTSYLTTNKLNTVCNQKWRAPYNKDPYQNLGKNRNAAWTFGVNQTWPGPGSSGDPNSRFHGESGNPGVITAIQADPFGTGYAEGAWAAAAGVAQACLLDTANAKFVCPTNKAAVARALSKANSIDYGIGSDGNPLGSSTPWCQLYIPPTEFVNPAAGDYPIVGLSYWLFYGNNNGIHLTEKKALITYETSSAASGLLGALEYTPLSAKIRTAVKNALNGVGNPSCLQ
ncbi:MAG TPA: substrate-binding domain-containing protein [Candidatus Cybelea sp.]|jgi:phosphate transport system substrate-binding protein|nr:substrate-binding domain-containing protein [Candidatus Cybelea sp.]